MPQTILATPRPSVLTFTFVDLNWVEIVHQPWMRTLTVVNHDPTIAILASFTTTDGAVQGTVAADRSFPIPAGATRSIPITAGKDIQSIVSNLRLAAVSGTPTFSVIGFEAPVS